jgi:hypothetical protein
VAVSVAYFVPFKVSNAVWAIASCGFFATIREGASVTALGVILIIHVATEMAIAMKPGTRASEYATNEPLRTVVTVGRARIRCVVIVPIRARWLDTDTDNYLSRCDVP